MTHDQLVLAAVVLLILVWRYLWVLAICAVLVAVDVAIARTYDGWREWAVYAAVPALFLAWVLLYPYATCPVCRGKGGSEFLMFSRRCWWCNGGKSKQRFTARMLGRGHPRQPGNVIAPKTRQKKR